MSLISAAASVANALIVHAHPEPASFSSAQADAVAKRLREAGIHVDRIDLYDLGWNPVLHRDQFLSQPGYFKPQAEQLRSVTEGTLEALTRAHLDKLLATDLLVLSFPLWWFSMPAIMKGWVDRVFVMGAAFGGEHGIFAQGGLRDKKAMLLVTTGGAEAAFAPGQVDGYGEMDKFLFHIQRGMLEFVGYDVLAPIITYSPARLDAHQRSIALQHAQLQVMDRVLSPIGQKE